VLENSGSSLEGREDLTYPGVNGKFVLKTVFKKNGDEVAHFVVALRCKPEGREFDSGWDI
jgi:5-formaminoimidazole-4-carboxamide-1-beta-D-ribofuranosyl 5'-monophosphate synthetase